jgi:adenylate cyclase
MSEIRRLRRAGGEALRLLVDLLPHEWDPRSGDEDVCLLFADVAGYSDFVAETGDDAAVAVLSVLDQLVSAALTGRKGARVVKRLGDGVMISTKRPEDSLRIGLSLVRGFDSEMRELGWPLRLRAGAHRGTTRRQGGDYFGYHVNLAARVADYADGGQSLVTANHLAGVDLHDLALLARPAGRLQAKGVTGPVEVFAVVEDPGAPRDHHQSPAAARKAS